MPPPTMFVDSDWLAKHIEDPGLVVLDVCYYPHRYYTVGHIPSAVQVQRFKDLGDNLANPLMRFPSREAFQATLRRWGINDDSPLSCYTTTPTPPRSRASITCWLSALYGFNLNQVKVLDGGTVEWSAFEEMSKEPVTPKPGNVTLKPADRSMYVEWTDVYDDVVSRRNPKIVLLDARPHDMYTGKVIKHAIMGWHIPGAINLVSLDGTSAQHWKSDQELRKLYAPVDLNKSIYVYCHDGFRMSQAYMHLKYLGAKDMRLYNGGWSHWGNRLALPTVEDEKPYAGDYEL